MTGMVNPAFGVVFAKGIDAFSLNDKAARRHEGDRTALWLDHQSCFVPVAYLTS